MTGFPEVSSGSQPKSLVIVPRDHAHFHVSSADRTFARVIHVGEERTSLRYLVHCRIGHVDKAGQLERLVSLAVSMFTLSNCPGQAEGLSQAQEHHAGSRERWANNLSKNNFLGAQTVGPKSAVQLVTCFSRLCLI